MISLDSKLLKRILIVVLFVCCVPLLPSKQVVAPEQEPPVVNPASTEGTALVEGIFRISNQSDVKVFQVSLGADECYVVHLRLDTIGEASLRLTVTCLAGPVAGIPITLFNRVYKHTVEGALDSQSFAAPDAGWYEFRLGVSDNPEGDIPVIPPYLIAVYFCLEDVGSLQNSRTKAAGPARTPLLDARWYTGDAGAPAYWDYSLTLESNATYYLCTCITFTLGGTWCPAKSVLVSAKLYPPGDNAFYPIVCEGVLNNTVLAWQTVWFGAPQAGTHVLRLRIDAVDIFRAAIGISVSRGDACLEIPLPNNTKTFELSGDNLTFTIATAGFIAGGGGLMAVFARRRKKQVQGSGGIVRRGTTRGGY